LPITDRIVLVSPYSDISSIGLRILSSCLKEAGFATRKVFLPIPEEKGDIPPGLFLYPQEVLEQVGELAEDAVFVGISLMTNYFDRVAQLCGYLRSERGARVVLGGIHATLVPQECARIADYVCTGEAEEAIVEVARALCSGASLEKAKNICFYKDGEFVCNAPRALVANLDEIPFPDYSLDDDYALIGKELVRMDKSVLRQLMSAAPGASVAKRCYYITMMTRGCRYACTYCCNRSLLRMYGGQRFVRRRSVENLISELVWVRENIPFVELFVISDDSFFDTEEAEIARFCEEYKSRVGLPFFCLGTPFGISASKLEMLVDSGLVYVQMGIQTGSERIRRLYKRPFSNEEIIELTNLLADYAGRILPPRYDIILDNPFETDQDVIETIKLLLKIKRPYLIQYFCLTLFPGTELAEKAEKAGIITDWLRQVYRKQLFHKRRTYLNFVISLFNTPIPRPIIRLLVSKVALALFNRPYFGRLLRLFLKD